MNWEIGIDIYILICIKQIPNENMLYSTGNSSSLRCTVETNSIVKQLYPNKKKKRKKERKKINSSHPLAEQGHTQGELFISGLSTIIKGRNCHPFCLGVRRSLNKPFLYYNLIFTASEKAQSLKSNFVILH